jgi:SAM-dependent methyltransferase
LLKVKYVLRNRKIRRAHRIHRKKHIEAYRYFDNILEKYWAMGGLKHAYQAYKLFSLREILSNKNPRSILELGTGTTTAIFVEYVYKSRSNLVCVDENEAWVENSNRLADVDDREKSIRFFHAPRIYNLKCNPIEVKYDISFDEKFAFIFIDGPSLTIEGKKYKEGVNTNIFDIARNYFPDTIVVDIRASTVKEIIQRIGHAYDYRISDVIIDKIGTNYSYFSIFNKK